MGLDMYAYSIDPDAPKDEKGNKEITELAYWRKHNALHGWMQNLWESSDDYDPEQQFNCIAVELSKDNLEKLRTAVKERKLKGRNGSFFGSNCYSEEDWKYYDDETYKFIDDGIKAINAGHEVYYDSWW